MLRSLLLSCALITAVIAPGCRLFTDGVACDPDDPATCPDGTTCNAAGICVTGDDPPPPGNGPVCGDAIVNGDEACDFAEVDGGACNFDCTTAACGDGKRSADEACDDSNTDGDDGCAADCTIEQGAVGPICGDGIVNGDEACDFALTPDTCNTDCTVGACGDGLIDGDEDCDTTNASCVACQLVIPAFCGNGQLDGGEACDAGIASPACNRNCTISVCNDGLLGPGEACDDGNTNADDGCAANCLALDPAPFCGDGVINPGEACDGSADCNDNCTLQGCGDGIVTATIGETCDGGPGCRAAGANACTIILCGDGIVDANEACDGGPGCTSTCRFSPVCDTTVVQGYCQVEITGSANNRTPRVFDIDGDGINELVTTESEQRKIFIQRQTAPGVYGVPTVITVTLNPRSIEFADVDGDGDLDIVSGGNNENALQVSRNNGAGVFTPEASFGTFIDDTREFDLLDFDGDGDLDIRVGGLNSDQIHLMRNAGNGTFTFDATTVAVDAGFNGIVSLASADFDGDGDFDTVTGNNNTGNVSLFRCDATGDCLDGVSLAAAPGTTNVANVAAGDVDADGDADLVSINIGAATLSIFLGAGDGTFATGTPIATAFSIPGGGPVSIADVTGDGRNEIVTSGDGLIAVVTNTAPILSHTLACPGASEVTVGDVNDDGRNDLVCTRPANGTVRAFLSFP